MVAARRGWKPAMLCHADGHSCPPKHISFRHPSVYPTSRCLEHSPELQVYRPLHPPDRDITIVKQHISERGHAEENRARGCKDRGA